MSLLDVDTIDYVGVNILFKEMRNDIGYPFIFKGLSRLFALFSTTNPRQQVTWKNKHLQRCFGLPRQILVATDKRHAVAGANRSGMPIDSGKKLCGIGLERIFDGSENTIKESVAM